MRQLYNIKINKNSRDTISKFTCKKNDDITVNIQIIDKDGIVVQLDNQDVVLYIRKPDETSISQTEHITITDNTININVLNQSTASPGTAYAEIEVRDDKGQLTSSSFLYKIEDRAVDMNNIIQSTDELQELEKIFEFMNKAKEDLKILRDEINEQKTETNKIQEDIDEAKKNIDDIQKEIESLDVTLSDTIQNATNINNTLSETVTIANNVEKLLQDSTGVANTVRVQLDELEKVATNTKTELQSVIDDSLKTREQLHIENAKAELNINSLYYINQEAVDNSNVLKDLIAEAKKIMGLLRDWIEQNGGSSEEIELLKVRVKKLEEDMISIQEHKHDDLYANISHTHSEFLNKNEADNKYEEKNEIGLIGENSTIPHEFLSAPAMLENEKFAIYCTYGTSISSLKHMIVYETENNAENARLVDNSYNFYVSNKTRRAFIYNNTTKKWDTSTDTYIRVFKGTNNNHNDYVYRNNFTLKNEAGTDILITEKVLSDVIATYNIEKNGKYKVKHKNDIEGCFKKEFEGLLFVKNVEGDIYQELVDTEASLKVQRIKKNEKWGAWNGEISVYNHTNADKMPENYRWSQLGTGFELMWIDVKMSDVEYGNGSGGLLMKTIPIPQEAQIFKNQIISATIHSFNREGTDTLSRVVQNIQVIDNKTVRARWRHTDNTYPRIDRFTVCLLGH